MSLLLLLLLLLHHWLPLLLHHWLPLLLLHWCYCHNTGRYTGPLRLMDFNYFSLTFSLLMSTVELVVLTAMLLLEELWTTAADGGEELLEEY